MPAIQLDGPTITAIATLVAAFGTLILALRNSQKADAAKSAAALAAERAAVAKEAAEESKREIVATRDGVFEVGKQLDGRLTELLKTTGDLARAEGQIEGRAAEQANHVKRADDAKKQLRDG